MVVTNQVTTSPIDGSLRPAGGNVVAHASTYRLWIRKMDERRRVATLIEAPTSPVGDARFLVTDEGAGCVFLEGVVGKEGKPLP